MAANKERTFIMVKPDGVQRGLVGKIIKRFEQKGFKLVALKFVWVSQRVIGPFQEWSNYLPSKMSLTKQVTNKRSSYLIST